MYRLLWLTYLESALLDRPDRTCVDPELSAICLVETVQDEEASGVKERVELLGRRCSHN